MFCAGFLGVDLHGFYMLTEKLCTPLRPLRLIAFKLEHGFNRLDGRLSLHGYTHRYRQVQPTEKLLGRFAGP